MSSLQVLESVCEIGRRPVNYLAEKMLQSFPEQFRAVVVGSTGTIGKAIFQTLQADARCGDVHLVFDATGLLHDEIVSPGKALKQVTSATTHSVDGTDIVHRRRH